MAPQTDSDGHIPRNAPLHGRVSQRYGKDTIMFGGSRPCPMPGFWSMKKHGRHWFNRSKPWSTTFILEKRRFPYQLSQSPSQQHWKKWPVLCCNGIISHKHTIFEINNQPHFRTYRKALAETKPRSSSWRFQSWVQVDQDLLWQQHLKCFPTKIGTCGVMKLEMVKIHCHSFTSPDLRSVAHVSWPKATREMPKSQTLISPLRLNLAEQQVDSRQMAP